MLLQLWIPAIILISECLAFYPYHQPSPSDLSSLPSSPSRRQARSVDNNGITIPLQKLPSKPKRDNAFSVVTAPIPTQTGSLAIDQDGDDISYFAAFTVGTSQKTFYLLLDSAASNTWIMSSTCTTQACAVHNTLGPSDSTSLQINSAQEFSVTYGSGSVSGDVATDTLHTSAFSVPFTFGLANNVSSEFASYAMDGIIGFGRENLITETQNNVNSPTLMDVLVSQKVIPAKLFGVHLWRASSGSPNNGELNLGAPDTSKYSGALNYLPAQDNVDGFWEVAVDDAGVDGKSAGLPGNTAILDTGTSFILMPAAHATALHALIPGSANPGGGETFTVPCGARSVIDLTLGGVAYAVLPADYVGAPVSAAAGAPCFSNIVGRQTFNATQWLLGDVFLKNVYAVFDFDGARVGFGTQAGDGDGPASGSSGSAVPTGSGMPAASGASAADSEPTATSTSKAGSTSASAADGKVSTGAGASSTASSAAASRTGAAMVTAVFDVCILALALPVVLMFQ